MNDFNMGCKIVDECQTKYKTGCPENYLSCETYRQHREERELLNAMDAALRENGCRNPFPFIGNRGPE